MNRYAGTTRTLFTGLFSAQMIATLQVYLSNIDLYRDLAAMENAGYFIIPSRQIMDRLHEFGPAFFGGLFFTMTIGAGLSILTLVVVWAWDRLFSRSKLFILFYLLFLIGCVASVNHRVFCPVVTSYFIVIPVVIFMSALKWMPAKDTKGVLFSFIPFILLGLLWSFQMSNTLFHDIRDNLLLSNSLGTKINNLYYKYTLYPAQVFKQLGQKPLKSYSLGYFQDGSSTGLLEKELRKHDYLNTGQGDNVDLKISQVDNILVFENRGRRILQTSFKDFLSRPASVLKDFSLKSDRHHFFRQFVLFSLVTGFPILVCIISHTVFRLVLAFFLDLKISSNIASIFCFLLGAALLVPFYSIAEIKPDAKDLASAMESDRWQVRASALKTITQKGIEVGGFPSYQKMSASPHTLERCWLVSALGVSRLPETYEDLLVLIDDPQPNVIRKAFYALGQRGETRAVKVIIKRINGSEHWYNQLYAYRALRTLGWKQPG